MATLTLNSLEEYFAECCKHSTPHREPDFAYLKEAAVNGGDTPVRGSIVFLEEHNTGYDGLLERWWFTVPDKEGTKITFMADLMPGFVSNRKETTDGDTSEGPTSEHK